jgi:hypothetical protein
MNPFHLDLYSAFPYYDESFTMDSSSSLPCAAFLLQEYLLDIPDPRTSEVDDHETRLPIDYEPTIYDVICGRGKGHYNRPGNKRFRSIVSQYVESYKPCQSRIHKSLILQQIIDRVREQDNGQALFLRYDSKMKCWCRMSIDHTREKVGHAMRECSQSSLNHKQQSSLSARMILLQKKYSSLAKSIVH